MRKSLLIVFAIIKITPGFSQTGTSQFANAAGNYSTTSSGLCLSCSFTNTSFVADMDLSNFAEIKITAGLAVSRGIRAKLTSLSPGNTYAGFYVNIGSVVSALPSVTISTYKNGSLRQTVITNGNIVTLMGGSAGYVAGLTNALDYDEVGISINGGTFTVGMTADVYYAIGGFNTPPLFVLPVKFSLIAVKQKANVSYLSWTTEDEGSVNYEIQRSSDGVHFMTIGTQTSPPAAGKQTFNFTDVTATGTPVYYRIAAMQGLTPLYSKTVSVYREQLEKSFTISPNPVTGSSFIIHGDGLLRGQAMIQVADYSGKILHACQLHNEGNNIAVQLTNKIAPGLYIVTIYAAGEMRKSLRMLVQ